MMDPILLVLWSSVVNRLTTRDAHAVFDELEAIGDGRKESALSSQERRQLRKSLPAIHDLIVKHHPDIL